MHASAQVDVDFAVSCSVVATEIMARVNGESSWVDPHNGGTYACDSSSCPTDGSVLNLRRRTGDDRYTDKFDFHFTAQGTGCRLQGCSESQVNSYLDMSTNYCNLRVLYCGSLDGCDSSSALACSCANMPGTLQLPDCGSRPPIFRDSG